MSEPQFTKGPWAASVQGSHVVVTSDNGMYHDVDLTYLELDSECPDSDPFNAEIIANAHLMAAAPCLYEVAELALDKLNLYHAVHGREPLPGDLRGRLRAVLMKAKGER